MIDILTSQSLAHRQRPVDLSTTDLWSFSATDWPGEPSTNMADISTPKDNNPVFIKPPRRKRKTHPNSSSLLRATIQEYGIYDKEVDAFKTQFVGLFDFLDSWQRNVAKSERMFMQMIHATGGYGLAWVDSKIGLDSSGMGRPHFYQVSRDLSIEEELHIRLARVISVARTLRHLLNKEREQKLLLFKDIAECKQKCVGSLSDMIQHFHKETGTLQHRLLEMDGTMEELENDKETLRQAYDDMVSQATKAVDILEYDLERSEQEVIDLTNDLRSLRASYKSLEEENNAFREEADELHSKIAELKKELTESQIQSKATHMAREHFETLLEIALNKLRLYEDGERSKKTKTRKGRLFFNRSANSQPNTAEDLTSSGFSESTSSGLSKKKYYLDNVSVHSYETVSEVSLPFMDSTRFGSEDRLYNLSQGASAAPPSPNVSNKKKKKKRFWHTGLKKSISADGQLSSAQSADRLPTIRDERTVSTMSMDQFRSASVSKMSLSEYCSTPVGSTGRQDSVASAEEELTREGHQVQEDEIPSTQRIMDTGELTPIVSCEQAAAMEEAEASKGKSVKKIQRTSSFAGLGKGGLVALAKDIEKRFRKKRRSKTADFSELSRINDKDKTLGKSRSVDDNYY